MSLITLCAWALVAVCALAIIKNFKSELFPVAVAACGVVLLTGVLKIAEPLFDFFYELEKESAASGFIPLLMKALGSALICQFTAEICRDCGENSVASKVEFAGKTVITVMSVPLIRELLSSAKEMIG
jgi:stage III sporulation protein AD